MKQRRVTACNEGNPHLWVHGFPGSGKTALMTFIYPKMYKKNLYNKFFDLYDPKEHTHMMLEDLDHEAVEKLSINFIKTICDGNEHYNIYHWNPLIRFIAEAGFSIDQKYKTPQLARTTVLVSSNFAIKDLIPETAGYDQNIQAIARRFWQVEAKAFLRVLGLKLISKYEIQMLKKQGNADPGKLFMTWDYTTETPLCEPIKTPEEYQVMIKDAFYK